MKVNVYSFAAQKMKFSFKDLFSKCDQIPRFLRIWSHLLKKYLIENFVETSSMSTPIIFRSYILGFPARSSNKNRIKTSTSFVKWSIYEPKKIGLFPFALFRILLFLWEVPVSHKSQWLKVVSTAKDTRFLPLLLVTDIVLIRSTFVWKSSFPIFLVEPVNVMNIMVH